MYKIDTIQFISHTISEDFFLLEIETRKLSLKKIYSAFRAIFDPHAGDICIGHTPNLLNTIAVLSLGKIGTFLVSTLGSLSNGEFVWFILRREKIPHGG